MGFSIQDQLQRAYSKQFSVNIFDSRGQETEPDTEKKIDKKGIGIYKTHLIISWGIVYYGDYVKREQNEV